MYNQDVIKERLPELASSISNQEVRELLEEMTTILFRTEDDIYELDDEEYTKAMTERKKEIKEYESKYISLFNDIIGDRSLLSNEDMKIFNRFMVGISCSRELYTEASKRFYMIPARVLNNKQATTKDTPLYHFIMNRKGTGTITNKQMSYLEDFEREHLGINSYNEAVMLGKDPKGYYGDLTKVQHNIFIATAPSYEMTLSIEAPISTMQSKMILDLLEDYNYCREFYNIDPETKHTYIKYFDSDITNISISIRPEDIHKESELYNSATDYEEIVKRIKEITKDYVNLYVDNSELIKGTSLTESEIRECIEEHIRNVCKNITRINLENILYNLLYATSSEFYKDTIIDIIPNITSLENIHIDNTVITDEMIEDLNNGKIGLTSIIDTITKSKKEEETISDELWPDDEWEIKLDDELEESPNINAIANSTQSKSSFDTWDDFDWDDDYESIDEKNIKKGLH